MTPKTPNPTNNSPDEATPGDDTLKGEAGTTPPAHDLVDPADDAGDAENAELLAAEDGAAPAADTTASTPEPPPVDPPFDEDEAELEELDHQARELGEPLELVQQLEFAPPPKARRGKAAADDDATPLDLTSVSEARAIVEALLFTTNEPLTVARLSRLMNNLHPRTVRGLLLELQMEYDKRGGGLQVVEVAGGFQMATRPHHAEWLLRLHRHRRRNPLTPATLETLAIVAYKQPVTKAELETVRGVESTAPLRTLQEIGLIEVGGRREVVGRPQLYITTDLFLKTFGLRSLAELPSISELKHLFAEEQKLQVKPAEPAAAPTDEAPAPDDADTPEETAADARTNEGGPPDSETAAENDAADDADAEPDDDADGSDADTDATDDERPPDGDA